MFTLEELKVGALAARKFQPGYHGSLFDKDGNPCPAEAICRHRGGKSWEYGTPASLRDTYDFRGMCEMLWHAAGSPEEKFPDVKSGEFEWTGPQAWFQHLLKKEPQTVAAMFDAIIVCADPTWSSLEAKDQPCELILA